MNGPTVMAIHKARGHADRSVTKMTTAHTMERLSHNHGTALKRNTRLVVGLVAVPRAWRFGSFMASPSGTTSWFVVAYGVISPG